MAYGAMLSIFIFNYYCLCLCRRMFACLRIRHFGGHVKSPLHSEQFAKKVTCLWEYSLLHAINKLTLFKLKLS